MLTNLASVPRPRRALFIIGVSLAMIAALLAFAQTASAAHYEESLEGSDFEIDFDANLIVESLKFDWGNVDEVRQNDAFIGQNDDSFGQGSKEDTAVPSPVTGSIPPNKSDLISFGIYQESNLVGDFLHMFWTRIQDPTGTTNMDFEFNQSTDLSANGVTPLRTFNDVLIVYELSQGGVNPNLAVLRWLEEPAQGDCEATNKYPCWGNRADLGSGVAAGSINTSPILQADADGLGALDPRTFGEATIDLSILFGENECTSLGSAYLKSRSSDSFTAALKDFIAPVPVEISNCGSILVEKVDDGDPAIRIDGAAFTVTPGQVIGGVQQESSLMNEVGDGDGLFCLDNLLIGTEYKVSETSVPDGYNGAADQTFTVTESTVCNTDRYGDTPDLSFVNTPQEGAIRITKTRKHAADGSGDHPHVGVEFKVTGGDLISALVVSTGADGTVCVDGLTLSDFAGNYTVTETLPLGYVADNGLTRTVTVDNAAECSDSTYVGEDVSFSNTPLSDITVSFASQVVGGTAATIECEGLTADPEDATPEVFDDTSEIFKNLQPGTYTCTVVIDP